LLPSDDSWEGFVLLQFTIKSTAANVVYFFRSPFPIQPFIIIFSYEYMHDDPERAGSSVIFPALFSIDGVEKNDKDLHSKE
jgi:hypothetical protein